jgi:hypothetical protein
MFPFIGKVLHTIKGFRPASPAPGALEKEWWVVDGFTRSYLKKRKIVRSQGRRRIVTGGIYVNISRITIQAGRRGRAI